MWEMVIWFDDQIDLISHGRKAVGSHQYMLKLREEGQLELLLDVRAADLAAGP